MNSTEEILKNVPDGNAIEKATESIMSQHNRRLTIPVDMNGYQGEFVVKYPSLKDKMNVGILRSKLTGGVPIQQLDVLTDNISYMSATLMVVTISAPKWFDIEIMDDYEVLDYVFTEYNNWVNSFRRTNQQGNNADSGKSSQHEEDMENM